MLSLCPPKVAAAKFVHNSESNMKPVQTRSCAQSTWSGIAGCSTSSVCD